MWFLEMLSLSSWYLNHILISDGLLVVASSKSITFPASQVDMICSLKTPWYCIISIIAIYPLVLCKLNYEVPKGRIMGQFALCVFFCFFQTFELPPLMKPVNLLPTTVWQL